jgi:hypothetical protein
MVVDDLILVPMGDRIERSARVCWHGDQVRLRIVAPKQFVAPSEDGSPFLAATLLVAMRLGEDLEIAAPVSRAFLQTCDVIQRIYRAWDPSLRSCKVRVSGTVDLAPRRSERGCFFSRGVDSMFSAGTSCGDGPMTYLIYCQGLDPIQDATVQLEDMRRAKAVADLLGLSIVLVSTNIRTMSDPIVDWADLFGAGLSAVAQCLGGGMGSVVIPSSADYTSQGPCGSSPLLDPLFSTESVEVMHGTIAYHRAEKVAALAAQRPDLIPHLKVCYRENRPDNCGRCTKCLWTMVCLEGARALSSAKSFPKEIPLDRIRALRIADYPLRIGWMQAMQALPDDARCRPLRNALRQCLRRSARPTVRERLHAIVNRLRGRPHGVAAWSSSSNIGFYREQTNLALSLLRYGKPYSPKRHPAAPR